METWINIYIPPEPSHIAIVDTMSNWKVTKKEQFWNHLKIFHYKNLNAPGLAAGISFHLTGFFFIQSSI